MNVGLFIRNLSGGGAERVAINLANELSTRHNVILFVIEKVGPYLDLIDNRVKLVKVGNGRLLTSVFSLAREIKKHEINVLLSNMTHENIIAAIGCFFSEVQIIAIEHNNLKKEIEGRGRLIYVVTKLFYKLVSSRMDIIVAVSQGVKNEIRQYCPKNKVVCIYNPLIENWMEEMPCLFESTPRNNAREGMIFVGRLTEQKNPHFAIDLFKHIVDAHGYQGTLTFLGDGHLLSELVKHRDSLGLQEKIIFAGFQGNPYEYMRRAQVLILTSYWEGFGNILVEGLFCGVKVVSYDCDYGPSEIINSVDIGTLVPRLNVIDFGWAVMNELKNDGNEKARHMRAKEFSVKIIAQKYEELFRIS
jgi:glycosyltransferase involved in cell wall biosynthesis